MTRDLDGLSLDDALLVPAAKALLSEFVDEPDWADLTLGDKHFWLQCVERVKANLP